jgi:ubiquinone/menaquinone biosynthesis C-methylase UbiE
MVPMLESRGRSGYLRVVRALIDEVHLEPGEQVLEVGCGTGVLDRWLARRTKETNRIVGVDINQYLLGEAKALAQKEGLQKVIEFKEGNAEALPFADNTFDVTMSCTVMEEVDAGRMMSELVRVTRPGGRVAVIVRAVDMPLVVNLPLPATIKAKAETNPGGVAEKGCADASLYRRFLEAGLTQVKMFPQLGAYGKDNSQFLESMILASLDSGEAKAWRAAAAQAQAAGTFLIGYPFHCAVGTKQI